MPWNYSLKLVVFPFILVSCFSNFPTTGAEQEEASDFAGYCLENVTTSSFQANVKSLFSSLTSNATVRPFYNDTVGRNTSDTVYGVFMCMGDVPSQQKCEQCVRKATQILSSRCYLSKKAIIWHRYCMVRYSNTFFFSILDTGFGTQHINIPNASNQARLFTPVLADTMNKTAAASGSRYFATKEASISENQTLYSLAQCAQDLSPQDCTTCLSSMIAEIPKCCVGSILVAFFSESCIILYAFFPLYYRVNNTRGGQGGGLLLLPETNKYSRNRAKSSSLDPDSYLSHYCPNNGTLYDYSARTLKTLLLSYLSSNATAIRDGGDSNNGFYKTDVEGLVFGLFMCRPDIPPRLCGECVGNATQLLASQCHSSVEAIVFYNYCLLRYSIQPFFSTVSTVPRFDNLNVTKVKDVERSFMFTTLSNVLAYVAKMAAYYSFEKYWWTESYVLNDYQTIYVLAQCTRDLSSQDCIGCLHDIIGLGIPWSKLASVGGRVVYPSCNLRFELFQFYSQNHHSLSPIIPPSPPPKGRNGLSRAIISSVVPIVIISVMFFSFYCYLLRKQARKSHKNILKENFGPESTTVESLQFDLAIIKIATNNFSYENRIGRGGFGEVYKGVLFDGRYIAVKRLSSSSKQGVAEFKNEVLLIARLQHRNLVTFIGFCLEEQEKILIYEYVPNKSLDYFLFDPHSKKLLNWAERYKIIEGIAQGVLYLHEYSRLKIIHRDIKPSNVLLDENMNSKISDFGLARIVEIDQQHGSTNKIVGTLGYMSPEYTLQGQFSEKLDVFSFGVMVLEIITGKKNVTSYKSHRVADGGLLSLVWREYRDQTPLSILDPKLKESYSEIEVSRCIQIGLLCVQEDPADRPTMINIVSYFSNPLFELPIPQEPVFFLRRKMDQEIVACESRLSSVNVMSISSFDPR